MAACAHVSSDYSNDGPGQKGIYVRNMRLYMSTGGLLYNISVALQDVLEQGTRAVGKVCLRELQREKKRRNAEEVYSGSPGFTILNKVGRS